MLDEPGVAEVLAMTARTMEFGPSADMPPILGEFLQQELMMWEM
jgi:hypothetical protein